MHKVEKMSQTTKRNNFGKANWRDDSCQTEDSLNSCVSSLLSVVQSTNETNTTTGAHGNGDILQNTERKTIESTFQSLQQIT